VGGGRIRLKGNHMMIALARWIGSSRADGKTHDAQGAAQKIKRLTTKRTKGAKKSIAVDGLR
jgi:hypothetical protein